MEEGFRQLGVEARKKLEVLFWTGWVDLEVVQGRGQGRGLGRARLDLEKVLD